MKLNDIKTKLFQRVTKTTYGYSFEIFDEHGYDFPKHQWPVYLLKINVCFDGTTFVVTKRPSNNKINIEQLNEITRVANILKENNK